MLSLIAAVALLAAEPAPAPEATPAPANEAAKPAAAEAPKKKPVMVCRREAVLGSNLPTRTCMTQEDWDQRKADGKDELRRAQRNTQN